jgi:hypothetical protein
MALRAKTRPDEAEPEGCGGSTVEGVNEVWPDFHPSDEDLSLHPTKQRSLRGDPKSPGTPVFAATRRDGANLPHFFVTRR